MSSGVGIDFQEKKIIQNVSEVVPNVFPHQDCLRHCPKWLHIGNKHNSRINSEIVARNVLYRYVCRKIIQNASEVVSKVSPHPDCHWDCPDCVRHSPKWQYIGHKNNGSRNREIAARSVFYNNAGRKLIQNPSAAFQNVFPLPDCVGQGPKWQYICHKNNRS